jgi:hypothetical protein
MYFNGVDIERDKTIKDVEYNVFRQLGSLSHEITKNNITPIKNVKHVSFEEALKELSQLNNSFNSILQ